jgi:hypothetical protein
MLGEVGDDDGLLMQGSTSLLAMSHGHWSTKVIVEVGNACIARSTKGSTLACDKLCGAPVVRCFALWLT